MPENKLISKIMHRVFDRVMNAGLMQEELTAEGQRYITEGMPELLRQAGAESCVLLENDGVLPLDKNKSIAVFGRCQLDWFYVGYGSGGDVSAPYYVNFMQGLENAGAAYDKEISEIYRTWCESREHMADHGWWGHWPMSHPEMPLDEDAVKAAAKRADTAVVVIGRAAGEDRENTLTEGSYYLTAEELRMLDLVTSAFSRTAIVLNIGNIIDMSWISKYKASISAVLVAWMGGMESGNSVCDILYGNASPCGRLSDTIAVSYESYPSAASFGNEEHTDYTEDIFVGYRYFDKHPEQVMYPFGFGLSYTSFEITPVSFSSTDTEATAGVSVKNTGSAAGKETVLFWCDLPQEGLKKPLRILADFTKTSLLQPGESETVVLKCQIRYLASFDSAEHCFIMDKGSYVFKANDAEAGEIIYDEVKIIEEHPQILDKGVDLRSRILENLPTEVTPEPTARCSFEDVLSGTAALEQFVSGLSDNELEALTRGHGMMGSSFGVAGNAGAFGGIIPSLNELGVPALITSDGPAGLRLKRYTSLLPCGTALACSMNIPLTEQIYALVAEEMIHYGVDVLLGPGMNIHRNPLCGRNFEYFSEDPLLSGKMAAAVVRGVQSKGKAACPKHFACNNQETKRNVNDSRVSERALREIYLRNFEICISESRPLCIMTSYNKINGVWAHYNYDLVTTLLRGEWDFDGTVITDWWMQKSKSPEFPNLRNNAYRVRAQVDVLMPGDMGHLAKEYKADRSLLETLGKTDGITRGEIQRSAENVLRMAQKLRSNKKPH